VPEPVADDRAEAERLFRVILKALGVSSVRALLSEADRIVVDEGLRGALLEAEELGIAVSVSFERVSFRVEGMGRAHSLPRSRVLQLLEGE